MKKGLLYLSMLFLAFVCNVKPSSAQVIELLKDIRVGSSGSAVYNYMSKANGKIFMMANDGIHGNELWVSDGTEAGTQLLKDIRSGSESSDAGWRNNFATANNKLFFIADDGVHGAELWVTDGTEAGTYLVKDIFPGSGGGLGNYGEPDQLYAYNGKVYFAAQDQDPYFDPESHGIELWCSDGTEEGTYMVKDIRPNDPTNYGTSGSQPQRFQEFNGLLYFEAYDGEQGVNGGHSGELWVTDGTEEGTHIVKDISSEQYSETPMYLTPCGDKMFFRTQTGEFGLELWATDGTEEGTYLVKDIFPGEAAPGLPNQSYPKYLTCLNGTLYFRANSYVQGNEVIGDLWESDGTDEGTINLSVDAGIHGIVNLKAFGDMVVFLGFEESNYNNWELYGWSEAKGVHLIKEINPDPTVGIDGNPEQNLPAGFVEYKNKLYFQAASVLGKTFLWETDGTEDGTIQTPGQENSVTSGTLVGGSEFTFIVSYGSLFYPARYNFTGSTGKEVYKLTVAPIDVYAVTGGGDYCQGDEGLPVGLSGSEEGVTYTLNKDGIAQNPTIVGTGDAISFGIQPAGTYTVMGSNVAGSLDMEGAALVNAASSIPVSVSITSDAEEVCAGETVTFTAIPENGGTNPSYQWYVNNNNVATGTNLTEFTYVPANMDVIKVELTSGLSCAANVGVSNTIILTVNEVFTPEVSIVASENPVYSSDPVTFTPTPLNGGDMPSYEWFVNDILVGTGETYEYIPINEDQVYVVLTSTEECVTSLAVTSNVIEMIVNNGIPAAYTVIGGGNYCEGSGGLPVTLSDSEIGVLYTLYKDGNAQIPTVEGTGEVISFGNQFEGVYTITGTNANTTTIMAGNAVIVELENLPVSVTIEPDHEPICAATIITFYAYPVNAGNNPTYQWFRNGSVVSGNNFNSYSFVPAIGDEVYVVVTSSLTCTTNNPATSEVYELDVLQMLLAEVSLAVDNNNVCEGTPVTFSATPVNGGDEPTYYWWLNYNPVGSNLPTFTYMPTNFDYVSVTMVPDPNLPCVGNSQAQTDPIVMIVNEVVTPSVSIVASENPVFIGYPVTFTPTPVNSGDTPIYQWFVNGSFAGTETPYTYTPEDGDQVYAEMASSLECITAEVVVSNSILMDVVTGIDINDIPGLKVYSADKVIYLESTAGLTGEASVYDIAGRKLITRTLLNETKTLIPASSLSNGAYIVKISNGNSQFNTKLFIR